MKTVVRELLEEAGFEVEDKEFHFWSELKLGT
jgi:8-oxo-dGTP pyrophosphatase MutT (NUDIX family)